MKELPTYQSLVNSFSKLPGIGVKSAERMAYAVLQMKEEDALSFATAIQKAKSDIHKCPVCGLYEEGGSCEVCDDETREKNTLVVVSFSKDALAFEKCGYRGQYHVLGGSLSPTKGIGSDQLDIDKLLSRVENGGFEEVILATNPTLEGETTALYIAKLLEKFPVNVTRLAYGLPMGASLDYADSLTLGKALEGRKKI
ncbi:MAG: recombination mediator RecR [Bacillota bacterium]|nr:recombination mediator RecR [Bacillota bacterium]